MFLHLTYMQICIHPWLCIFLFLQNFHSSLLSSVSTFIFIHFPLSLQNAYCPIPEKPRSWPKTLYESKDKPPNHTHPNTTVIKSFIFPQIVWVKGELKCCLQKDCIIQEECQIHGVNTTSWNLVSDTRRNLWFSLNLHLKLSILPIWVHWSYHYTT